MKQNPFISIVMPVYNAEKYLNEIFQSVLNQTYQDWELIVVNDCSKDESVEICDSFAKTDDRIRVIHLSENGGAGNARNHGMEEATGKYITFIDADDQIDSNAYEKVIEVLKRTDADVVAWGVVEEYYDEQGQFVWANTLVLPEKFCENKKEVEENILLLEQKTLLGYQWNKVYRAEIIQKHDIKFKNTILYEDYFFNVDVIKNVESMYVMKDAFYHYKNRFNDSITTKYIQEYFELSYRRVQVLNDLCSEWNIDKNTKNKILGNIYLRYILSALMRNSDNKSKMSKKQQEEWARKVAEDRLYKELSSEIEVTSKSLSLLQKLLNAKRYRICVGIGNVVLGVKSKSPMFFSLIKRNK